MARPTRTCTPAGRSRRKSRGRFDQQRDFDAFVLSANAETHSSRFFEWAGDERVTLAIVFTDLIDSTALGIDVLGACRHDRGADPDETELKIAELS
jgi:hypothetical protein